MLDPFIFAGSTRPTMSIQAMLVATALSPEHADPFHGLQATPWPTTDEDEAFWDAMREFYDILWPVRLKHAHSQHTCVACRITFNGSWQLRWEVRLACKWYIP